VREARLAAFRERVRRAPVDPAVVAAVRARALQMFPGVRVRFRSSTNAEDLPGFNGAGLYRSVVAPATLTEAQVADALRDVWSSVWSFQGFEERSFYRIDQSRVAMAILVQESIDDDTVDGVAITANPFNQGRPAHFINVQVAGREGGAITSARGGEVPEQIVYYTYNGEGEYERLSSSSLTRGAPVLREPEVINLARVLTAIHVHFHPNPDWTDGRAMDVEFILAGPTRRLVIVQARPYTVHWTEGQGWAQEPR
jgi:phosphoenolpyruvate synthase/pyruvate phosphate dikinase